MSDLFDLVALLHGQNEADVRAEGWDKVHAVMVAPDVWQSLQELVPRYEGPAPLIGVNVLVNRYLPRGAMVPIDRNGKPIKKPATLHKRSDP